MKIKKQWWLMIAVIIGLLVFFYISLKVKNNASKEVSWEEVLPELKHIQTEISTTGVVQPQNRLEIKPPIDGRVDEILVHEGDVVKKGQILAWMSSMDRAALLDSAMPQGEDVVKYWQNVYKPIPLMSPINGQVIVRSVEPGQSITKQAAVLVLADQLIVKAQVDETDIGRIKINQKSVISLDAYPDQKINALVSHIAYESETVNNVTIYQVENLLHEVPDFCRSGMSATVQIIENEKENALVIPIEAVKEEKGESFVYIKQGDYKPRKSIVQKGIINDVNVEIISGLAQTDTVMIRRQKYPNLKQNLGSPFSPMGAGRRTR